MRPPDEQHAALEFEILAAERELVHGQFARARDHLKTASAMGARKMDVNRLHASINAEEQSHAKRARLSGWGGFGIGGLGYLFLSLQQPVAWTMPLWCGLAFLAIPAIAGYAMGRWQGQGQSPQSRFWSALFSVGWAMCFYTAISLMSLRWQIGLAGQGGAVLVAGTFVSAAYALVAGTVAGVVSAKLAWHGHE